MPFKPIITMKDRILYDDGWRHYVEVPIDGDETVRLEATDKYLVQMLKVRPLDRTAGTDALREAANRLRDTLQSSAGVDVNGKRVYRLD